MSNDFSRELRAHRLLVVLRAEDSRRTQAVVDVLVAAGVRLLELTLTTPGATRSLAALRDSVPGGCRIGLGSGRTAADIRSAAQGGADFVVTPVGMGPDDHRLAHELGLVLVPGAATPSEVAACRLAGARAVKLFPASCVGGPAAVRAIRQPMPEVELLPTGGVTIEEIPAYLAAGAVAVGVGGPLLGDAMEPEGDLVGLARRARRAVELVQDAA
jgi:2-dehydro-3-deoxyphosphogluconate aldolase/(4S)-4-hydroxy-2-oxoglutarate aldolase